ncbi:uncharacterized protein SAPINGB_P001888 [Magnusiomyces paraingens]|uniref:Purple acid phosphatase n=1 Tax=Magnusiomyces paraingens TaxID=2606893 RepID=A0A5E8BC56_9ASCO|nr:uncharacterized protein SAPINGB_P001888 [Saprochaete ingens]VVT48660.1 unnamed protein product [Saprochaete ingens]
MGQRFSTVYLWAVILVATLTQAIPMPQALPIPENRLAPIQHRLALAGSGGMAVSWNTYTKLDKAEVFYGTKPDQLTNVAGSYDSSTYPSSTTFSNHVKLSGLAPNTVYYYRVSHTLSNAPVMNFTTPPETGKSPLVFAVAIDLGTMGPLGLSETTGEGDGGALLPGERNTIDALAANLGKYSFVWHPGDIGYADYWLKEQVHGYLPEVPVEEGFKVYESILNTFYEQISKVSAYVPYMVGPGNHEANCDNGGVKDKKKGIAYTVDICIPGQTNFSGYQSHWRMPNEESGGFKNMWYSFDYGPVHFVQINTETDFGRGIIAPGEPGGNGKEYAGPFARYADEQQDWLERDLKNVDRCKTPWVIVAGHRPWYAAGKDGCSECQDAFEAVLVNHGVDVVVFGHVHNYQRFDPMKFGEVDPRGLNNPSAPWYLLNGVAGHYDGMDKFEGKKGKQLEKPTGFKVGFDDTYGWSRFIVHNSTHLTHEFVASRNDSVLDKATLFKHRSMPTECSSRAATGLSAMGAENESESDFTSIVDAVRNPDVSDGIDGFDSAHNVVVAKMAKTAQSGGTGRASRQSSPLGMIVAIAAILMLL